jgi:hypothetical protein
LQDGSCTSHFLQSHAPSDTECQCSRACHLSGLGSGDPTS